MKSTLSPVVFLSVLVTLSPVAQAAIRGSRVLANPPKAVAVIVVGHVDRYLPFSTISRLVGSGVRAGLTVDYYAALAGPNAVGLKEKVADSVKSAGGRLAGFSINSSSGTDTGNMSLYRGSGEWQGKDSHQLASILQQVHATEKKSGDSYIQVVLVREDAYWLSDPEDLWKLAADRSYFRACANDGAPATVYVLARNATDNFLGRYAEFLSSSAPQAPAELFLLDVADELALNFDGLDATALPVVPAGRAGDFGNACAKECDVVGCDPPPELPKCANAVGELGFANFSNASTTGKKVPCLNGQMHCYSAKQMLTPAKALRLYQMGDLTDKLLSRHGIWHFAHGGTLLGAVRNKGIIPHDDDMDFNILSMTGAGKVTSPAFKASLKKNGLYLAPVHQDFWKVKDKYHPSNPAVDIFAMHIFGDLISYRTGYWPGTQWPKSIMNAGGLVRWSFGSSTVPAPPRATTEAGLDHKFGTSWRDEVNCKGGYHSCTGVTDEHYDLTGRAMPDSPLKPPI